MRPLLNTDEPLFKSYLMGFFIAIVLTIIPFGLVDLKLLPALPTVGLIAVLAATQMIVHLRYFLHVDHTSNRRDNLCSLVFAAVVIFIMAGGTVWIIFNLQYRMMV
jgi:cytochrome o ubiquinol oxidase operon protein cyoD